MKSAFRVRESGDNYSTDEVCTVCHVITENGNTLHHVKTRGSGGSDDPSNLMPLCHAHHVEVHASGLTSFSKKHKRVMVWLKCMGWTFSDLTGKWSQEYQEEPCFASL